jgi:hypothetical protein
MTKSDWANIIAATATVLALALALYQHRTARKTRAQLDVRIAQLETRVNGARQSAQAIGDAVDAMVQRAKEPGVKVTELQDKARVIRANLLTLVQQIEPDHPATHYWVPGGRVRSTSR